MFPSVLERRAVDVGEAHRPTKLGRFSAPTQFNSELLQSEKYDGWLRWKTTFDVAIAIMDGRPSDTQKIGLLYTHVGDEVRDLITMLKLPPMHSGQTPSDAGLYAELSKGLNDYFRTLVDESTEFARYTARKQATGEGVHKYAMKLRELGERVGVGYDSIPFKHQFIAGLSNREFAIRAKQDGLKIGVILERAGRMEQEAEAEKQWAQTDRHGESVMRIASEKDWKKPMPGRKRKRSPQHASSNRSTESGKCPNCGLAHFKGHGCPATGKKCLKCGRMNHFARTCRSEPTIDAVVGQRKWKNDDSPEKQSAPQVK